MEVQVSPKNKPVAPWKDVCCESCWTASEDRCRCKCNGKYHGVGNMGRTKQPTQQMEEQHNG